MISSGATELRCYLNLMAPKHLPETSTGPRQYDSLEALDAVHAAGYDGVQFAAWGTPRQLSHCRRLRLGVAAAGRVNLPAESDALAEQCAGDGYECATLHVGWGLEDDRDAHRLIASVIEASRKWRIPLYIETHRATILQDMWRTVGFVRQFPELRLNGDFSHWYTGQEMVYGGFETKLAFLLPIFKRIRFIHGRIGNPGCMQVRVDPNARNEPEYVQHFKRLWTLCFEHFRRSAQCAERIYFTPELLAPDIYYARTFPSSHGVLAEESDRWEQSLVLKRIAEQCFQAANSDA